MRQAIGVLTWLAIPSFLSSQQLRPTYTEVGPLAEGPVYTLAESPNGRFVIYGVRGRTRGTEELRLFDRTARASRKLGQAFTDYAWSPRGDMIAYAAPDDRAQWLYIWTVRMDPRVGLPIGEPRRISMTPGRGPAFSPDGRSIAFTVIPPTDSVSPRIVVVPTSGGSERAVLRARGYSQQLNWSPDGQWIYYRHHSSWNVGDMVVSLNRVAVTSGVAQTLRKVHDVIGMSKDGNFLAYYPDGPVHADHPEIGIATADGVELGRLSLPRFVEPATWSFSGRKLVATRNTLPKGLTSVDVRRGGVRELSGGDASDEWPALSPDGLRLGFVSYLDDRRHLVIMPARGGERRLIATHEEPDRRPIRWSPNGRYLAFSSKDGRALNVVDVLTGTETRVNGQGTVPWDTFAWRSDALALFFVRQTPKRREIVEVSLGGMERHVRDLEPTLGSYLPITFIGDSVFVVTATTAVHVGSLRDGSLRQLFAPRENSQAGWLYGVQVSWDGRLAAVATTTSDEQRNATIHILPLDGAQGRAIPIASFTHRGPFYWHPDGQHLVVVGRASEMAGPDDVFLLPLNGEPLRPLTTNGRGLGVLGLSVSGDGESIAFFRLIASRATLWDIDLSRALDGLASVPP